MTPNYFIPLCILLYSFAIALPDAQAVTQVTMDKNTSQKAQVILSKKTHSIDAISSQFLNTPYVANTLIGSSTIPEKLVINLNAVDCFTFIDYVLALYQSKNINDFPENLINIRYINGKISFFNRKHFFSDWYTASPNNAQDFTKKISPNTVTIFKHLNQKPDGTQYLPGLGIIPRNIHYIPSIYVNEDAIKNLKTGDFIGILSPKDGLDASHVGILIKKGQQTYFRNASSLKKNMKVVDSPLLEYIKNKPGIMVLRVQ